MVILGSKGLSGWVKGLLDLFFIGGIGVWAALPVILNWYFKLVAYPNTERYGFILVILYTTGLFALFALNEMRRIFRNLNQKGPFIEDHVTSLKRIAVASLLISISYFIKVFFHNSLLTIIFVMVFLIAGLFSIVLAEVFRQAIIVKEENDLTI